MYVLVIESVERLLLLLLSQVQVNVTSEMAEDVVEMSNSGVVRADLVHGPTTVLYPVVDHWWRRYKVLSVERGQ